MSEVNKAIVRRLLEVAVGDGDIAILDEIVDANFVEHGPLAGTTRGLEGLKQRVASARAAFPDLHATVEDVIAEGDKVVARITVQGTHKGEFVGVPATGQHFVVSEIHIARIVGGKMVEHWSETNVLGLMQQLGLIPASGQLG